MSYDLHKFLLVIVQCNKSTQCGTSTQKLLNLSYTKIQKTFFCKTITAVSQKSLISINGILMHQANSGWRSSKSCICVERRNSLFCVVSCWINEGCKVSNCRLYYTISMVRRLKIRALCKNKDMPAYSNDNSVLKFCCKSLDHQTRFENQTKLKIKCFGTQRWQESKRVCCKYYEESIEVGSLLNGLAGYGIMV